MDKPLSILLTYLLAETCIKTSSTARTKMSEFLHVPGGGAKENVLNNRVRSEDSDVHVITHAPESFSSVCAPGFEMVIGGGED